MTNNPTPPASQDALRVRLKDSLGTIRSLRARVQELEKPQPLAVVGLSCRLPGGASPEEFWQSLTEGRSFTSDFPEERHPIEGYLHPDPDHPGTAYTLSGNFLSGPVDGFDPTVFGISPREAAGMDPQQRLILELAWEALEDAGLPPTALEGSRTGVFLGASTSDYVRMRQQEGAIEDVDAYQLIGEPSFLAGRISYTFGFQGPSMVIDTACSSSLVALEQASLSLRSGGCDTALVGGVNLMLSPYGFVLVSKLRALSPDAVCRTFDADANGYARGEGGALLVLKRLSDAEAAGDRILALVRGVATEHDGRSSGLTVPNPTAQQGVIRSALKDAGVAPAELSYVEAHGTGTQLGDPIELVALDAVTTEGRSKDRPLLVGSVKTNIGHLEPAAGAASLVKVVLAMQHDSIPKHLHLNTPNPQVAWDDLNLTVTTEETPWPAGPKITGISSFGASGTNAHVVLSEAPKPHARTGTPRETGLLTLSANTPEALRAMAAAYVEPVAAADAVTLADICYSTQIGRARLKHALTVAGTREQLVAALTAYANGERHDHAVAHQPAGAKARRVAWLFTGQGSQYPGMAQGLSSEPVFAEALREALAALDPHLPEPLGPVLAGEGDAERINRTGYTQPALFAVEYALAKLWESWGVTPTAVLGHSLGEISAACVAGVHSLADAARLVAARARLMDALPAGGVMETAVCDEATARAAIAKAGVADRVSIAAVNGPTDVVLSGAQEAVDAAAALLAAQSVKHRRLVVSHAFHSPLMAPMLDEFRREIADLTFHQPKYRLISNVTGKEWGPSQLRPEYWVEHVSAPVRFAQGIAAVHAEGCRTFLEVGPAPILLGLGARCLAEDGVAWVPSLRRDREDAEVLAQALGALNHRGVSISWEKVHQGTGARRTALPSYPWQRDRYWFESRGDAPENRRGDDGPVAVFDGHQLSGPPTWTPDLAALPEEFIQIGPDGRRSVSPGGFCNWALTGAAHQPGAQPRLIERFVVGEPLYVDHETPTRVRVYVLPQDDEGRSLFLCYSLPGGAVGEGDTWRLHARGLLSRTPADARPARGELNDIRSRCLPLSPTEISVPAWAEPVLTEVLQGPGEILAEVNGLAESLPRGALLDLTLMLLRQSSDAWELGVPVPQPSVRQQPNRGTRRYIHGWLDEADNDGELQGGLEILGADGTVLISVRLVQVRDAVADGEPVPRQPVEQTVWDMVWQADASTRAGSAPVTGRVLLIGGGRGPVGDVATALAALLTEGGAEPVLVDADADTVKARLEQRNHDHVVLLSGLELAADCVENDAIERARTRAEHVFLAAARTLAEREADSRLWVVTRGAQFTGTGQRRLCLPAGPLWGLGKVAALEHPELWGGLLDLDPADRDPATLPDAEAAAEAAAIAAFMGTESPEDLVALRGGARLVPRLVAAEVPEPPARPVLTDLGSYLVTGGLGSLGLLVAEWLARSGAGTIVLSGRSGLPERGDWDDLTLDPGVRSRIASVRRIESHGAQVRVAALDVADQDALTALVDELERAGRPLRGVVHAAGVSEPQFLREADPVTYDQALHAKVAGTWALHQATLDQRLDVFVSFSSIASVWGSQHLAGYSAANAFLDSVAHYRRLLGLPATTVSWGPWGAKSGLADDAVMDFLRSIGLYQLNPEQALELLGDAVARDVANRTVCAADWPMFKDLMEARRERPVLREIKVRPAAGAAPGAAGQGRLTAQLLPLDRAGRQAVLDEYVRAQLSEILRMELPPLTEDTRLAEMGLDSLMVMELISRCREDLQLEISSREFFACPGINWSSLLHELFERSHPAESLATA